ncbi:hypothetical protein HYH03_002216 [Edaphochlamys debaryana]|uniref:Signal recognition particle subunit SRP72 n=1 Tax=Edaphochlamys debaryana TaxID=47281 RepID=A0A836C5K1_9CHLO|nr:hypothetical protein HYH03_002216 [Edaphochlamys debaryana]|eukprot:KAG2499929.1 hypothetical protein HYH03_002216 [Edaphochlamys debaryana]
MASDATPLEQAFERLNTSIKNQQHKKALKACDEILAIAPGDADALRCKVVAHMQLSEFQQALSVLSKPPLSTQQLSFEKAYCQYRLGQIEEALAVTGKALADAELDPAAAPPLLQLQAQLQYRKGATKDCIHTYDRLFQQHKADSLELKTNVLAAYVAAGLAAELPDLMAALKVKPRDSFEVAFNRSCGLVEAGQLGAAEGELRMALKLGRETLFEEDLAEEEVDDELGPLSCQLAYVLGRLGRTGEATEVYDKLIRGAGTCSDEATRAVAHNNAVADAPHRLEPGPQNRKFITSATKRLEALVERPGSGGKAATAAALAALAAGDESAGGTVGALAGLIARHTPAGSLPKFAEGLESRLGAAQKMRLLLNLGLLYLAGGKADAARELLGVLAAAPGGAAEPDVAMLSAAVSLSLGKTVDADRALEAFAASCGSGAPGAPPASAAVAPTLMRAQAALEAGAADKGLALLAALGGADPAVGFSGAVVATRVALHEQLNDPAGAEALLDAAVAHWRGRGAEAGAAAAQAWCLGAAVGLKLRLGKLEEAKQAFKQLQASGLASTATGAATLARLARSCALADPASAPALVASLAPPPSAAALSGLDLDALEEGAVRTGGAGAAARARGPDLAAGELAAAARAAVGGKRGGDAMDTEKQPKAKKSRKKRKPLLPAAYNPELPGGGLPPPDPERWLPKWERSDYKKKRDRRRKEKDAVKGSQGAGKVDESLDRTNAPAPSAAAAKAQPAKPTLPPRKKGGKK